MTAVVRVQGRREKEEGTGNVTESAGGGRHAPCCRHPWRAGHRFGRVEPRDIQRHPKPHDLLAEPWKDLGTACCGLLSSKEVPRSWDSNGTLCHKIRATTLRRFRAPGPSVQGLDRRAEAADPSPRRDQGPNRVTKCHTCDENSPEEYKERQ